MATRQLLRRLLKSVAPAMYMSSIFAHCAQSSEKCREEDKLKLEIPDIKKLTYEFMIQQSTLEAVNSATRVLTVTCMAITHVSDEYRALLNKLISLMTETLSYDVSDAHWDLIVKVRTEMEEKKESVMKLTSYMDYVHKMAIAASELSFLSGMDSLSNTLCLRIDDALSNVRAQVRNNLEAEQAYRRLQEQCVKDSKRTSEKR